MLMKRSSLLPVILFLFYVVHVVKSEKLENEGPPEELFVKNADREEKVKIKRAHRPPARPSLSGETCYGYKAKKGKCLPLESCVLPPLQENYIKHKDYFCVTKERKVGVCCPTDLVFPTQYNKGIQLNTKYSFKSEKKRQKRDISVNEPPQSIKSEINTCGRNGEQLSEELKTRSWPWVASLKIASSKTHFCGAALITRYHLLTAAHCFVLEGGIAKKENVIARLGEYDLKDGNGTKHSDHKIAEIIYHEDYDRFTYENDISLLLLEFPAQYSIYVQPICMPQIEEYNDRKAVIVGWGHVKTGGPGSQVLREIEVPVWQHASCEDSIAQTIFTTNLCAGDKDGEKDACQNDSGGPLMVQRNVGLQKRWELAGIVSWGVKCAQKGRPGVYTQVNKYFDWIYEKIGG